MLLLLIPVLFAALGAVMAAKKGRNVFGWCVLSFFFPLIGVIILVLLPALTEPAFAGARNGPTPVELPDSALPPMLPDNVAQAAPAVDRGAQWNHIVHADPRVRRAVDELHYAPAAVAALRDAYLALLDPQLLPVLVASLKRRYPPPHVVEMTPPPPPPWTGDVSGLPGPPPLRTVNGTHAPSSPPPRREVPRHTTVTDADLTSARYIESHRGIHLFELEDGRVYIDGHVALASLESARHTIDRAAGAA